MGLLDQRRGARTNIMHTTQSHKRFHGGGIRYSPVPSSLASRPCLARSISNPNPYVPESGLWMICANNALCDFLCMGDLPAHPSDPRGPSGRRIGRLMPQPSTLHPRDGHALGRGKEFHCSYTQYPKIACGDPPASRTI